MANLLYQDDIPDNLDLGPVVAVDTETMGLNPFRDRLCLVQLCAGDGNAHLVQLRPEKRDAQNLVRMLEDPEILKIFHYARFDLVALMAGLDAVVEPVYCTKIASRLVRTYTDKHGLKELCKEVLGVDISKQMQSSDWGAERLTAHQLKYAAADVLYLHRLREELNNRLEREHRLELAQEIFRFLPARARLDFLGWHDTDIFAH